MPTSSGSDGDEDNKFRDHRDQKSGRFLKGNPGGGTPPHTNKIAQLRKAFYSSVNDADISDVIKKMIELAKNGDVNAAKVVLAYGIGPPDSALADPFMDELTGHRKLQIQTIINVVPREKLIELVKLAQHSEQGSNEE